MPLIPALVPWRAQPDTSLRRLVNYCFGSLFPVSSVLDPGALPSKPYDLAFWGFPCDLYSGLQRDATTDDIQQSLALLDSALAALRRNPPRVFVLENTASMLALPSVLSHVCASLSALPYEWRCLQ